MKQPDFTKVVRLEIIEALHCEWEIPLLQFDKLKKYGYDISIFADTTS